MNRIYPIFLLLTLIGAIAPAQTISTIAGGGPLDNAKATDVSLTLTQGVTTDSLGNAYFTSQSKVFKLEPSGNLSLVAGTTEGFSGDNGPATLAQLRTPYGLVVDKTGNIYVADFGNNRIRKISPSGIITTVVGTGVPGLSGDEGPATSAELRGPYGVSLDKDGNLLIADSGNHRVRRVTGDGIIHGVAGYAYAGFSGDGGAADVAQIYFPTQVAADSSNNLYIADYGNNRIRKVTAAGIISTFAGNGAVGEADGTDVLKNSFSGPASIVISSSGDFYVTDFNGHKVRKISSAGAVTTVAGNGTPDFKGDGAAAASANLWYPRSVAVDSSGNLFIADLYNQRIRKVTSSGTISTVAGNGAYSFGGDGGSALGAQLNSPSAAVMDAGGNLYIADYGNHRVRRVTAAGAISTLAGTGTPGFGGDGSAGSSAQLNYPTGLALDAAGNLYVADSGNHRVRRITPAGTISSVAGNGTAGFGGDGAAATGAQLQNPSGVAVDGDGNLYIADYANHRVRRVSPAGTISTVAGSGTLGFAGDGGAATNAQLKFPQDIAVDSKGNLYIADLYNQRIRVVNAAGIINTFAGTGDAGFNGDEINAKSAQLNYPYSVAVDAGGNVLISDYGNQRIRLVAPTGNISTIAGSGVPGFSGDGADAPKARLYYQQSISLDPGGNILIADSGNRRIRKVAKTISVTLATDPAGRDLTVDGNGIKAPLTFNWLPDSVHSLSAPSPQTGPGARYTFQSWTNSGAQTQSYKVPALNSDSLTAKFATAYQVSVTVNGPGTVTSNPSNADSYFAANSSPVFTAVPNNAACQTFAGWSGTASGYAPLTVFVDQPKSITANFTEDAGKNVTANFRVTSNGFTANSAQGTVTESVTIQNTGAAISELNFVLDGLSGGTLANGVGVTVCAAPVSSPVFRTGAIGAGQSITISLVFNSASGTATYSPRLLGPGAI